MDSINNKFPLNTYSNTSSITGDTQDVVQKKEDTSFIKDCCEHCGKSINNRKVEQIKKEMDAVVGLDENKLSIHRDCLCTLLNGKADYKKAKECIMSLDPGDVIKIFSMNGHQLGVMLLESIDSNYEFEQEASDFLEVLIGKLDVPTLFALLKIQREDDCTLMHLLVHYKYKACLVALKNKLDFHSWATLLKIKNTNEHGPIPTYFDDAGFVELLVGGMESKDLEAIFLSKDIWDNTLLHTLAAINHSFFSNIWSRLNPLIETLNLQDSCQNTVFNYAVLNIDKNYMPSITQINNKDKLGLLSIQNEEGDTLLHIAIYQNKLEKALDYVSSFIELEESDWAELLSIQNNAGQTPFDMAVVQKSTESFELLLGKLSYANRVRILSIRDHSNRNILDSAAIERENFIFFSNLIRILDTGLLKELMVDRVSKVESLLHTMSRMNKSKKLLLIASKLDKDWVDCLKIKDINGNTPLHIAVEDNYINCVKSLLSVLNNDGWTDVLSIKNNKGYTPLHLAAMAKMDDEDDEEIRQGTIVLEFLTLAMIHKNKDSLLIKDHEGNTVLHHTVIVKYLDALIPFMQQCDKPFLARFFSIKNNQNEVFLHLAATYYSCDIWKKMNGLVSDGVLLAALKQRDTSGDTALHLFSYESVLALITLLKPKNETEKEAIRSVLTIKNSKGISFASKALEVGVSSESIESLDFLNNL